MNEFTLEDFRKDLANVEAELAGLIEERDELKELIAKLVSDEIADNEGDWSAANEYGARQLLPKEAIKEELLAGNRAEVFFAKTKTRYQFSWLIAPLGEDASPDQKRMYGEGYTTNFGLIALGHPVYAKCYTEDGERIPDVYIPIFGSGAVDSRKNIEAYWKDEKRLKEERFAAEIFMVKTDRKFRRYVRQGKQAAFMEKYPYYEV